MTGALRFFTSEPLRSVLGQIEGVNLIEVSPKNIEQGAGSGVVCVVGECEDGPYNTPTEIRSPDDLLATFGDLGFIHDGSPGSSPVAVRSGGSELWNGNMYVALNGYKFSRLIVVRVKTAAGQVSFRRYASLTATERGPHDLEPGDDATFEVDGTPVTGTLVAVAGTIQAVGGTYPTNFTGVEVIYIKDEFGNIRAVKFAATDQAIADVINAINKHLAYTAATNVGGQIKLTSRIRGSRGYIEITGASGASVLTQLGFTLTNTAEVDRVTVVNAVTGDYTFSVTVLYNGQLTAFLGTYTANVGPDTEEDIRDALIADFEAQNPLAPVTLAPSGTDIIDITSNVAGVGIVTAIVDTPNVGDFTTANITPNSASYGNGNGNVADVDRVLDAELAVIFDALGGLGARILSTGFLRFWNDSTPESGTLEFTGGAVGEALGFTDGDSASAGDGQPILIRAGTRVLDDAGFTWVTCVSTTIDTTGGPFLFDVRPAADDDTTPTAAGGTVNTLVDVLDDEFEVSNTSALTRLGPGGFDAAYETALKSTIDGGGLLAPLINIITCARLSEAIVDSIIANVVEANAENHALRVGIFAPPLGFSVDDAINDTAQGVPAAAQEPYYVCTFPGWLTKVNPIAAIGAKGGLGFSDDGLVQRRSHVWYASVRSLLPPEENAGQDLTRSVVGRSLNVVGLENRYNSAKGGTSLKTKDYIAMKAAGICTMKMDADAGACVQSDLTCRPESKNSDECDANHRFMFNFLGDSLRKICKPYLKQLKTPRRRVALVESQAGFLRDLKSEDNQDLARIADFEIADRTTPTADALGHADISVMVQRLQALKYINVKLTLTAQGIKVTG